MNQIGIMHGRLSPPIEGKIQAFPKDTWREEFFRAAALGFDALEFIFDGTHNPLFTGAGALEASQVAADAGVEISSVCCDYTMFSPLFGEGREEHVGVLLTLIQNCAKAGIPRIGVSLEDDCGLRTARDADEAIDGLRTLTAEALAAGMTVTLETSLHLHNVFALLERVGAPNLKLNFDLGNSCCVGEDTPRVIEALGDRIGGVHIKDRTRLLGTTVPLGEGDVDFPECFQSLRRIGYEGVLLIQAARGENDTETAGGYRRFVLDLLADGR